MSIRILLTTALALTLSQAAVAADYPQALADRPVVVFKGMLEARGDLGISLSNGTAFKGYDIGGALRYGFTDDLEGRIALNPGLGICIDCGGTSLSGLNIGGYYALARGSFSTAVHGNVVTGPFDPFYFGVQVGLRSQLQMDRFWIGFDPTLQLKLTPSGNLVSILVPVRLSYNFTPEWAPYILTGLNIGSFDPFGLSVPLGLGVMYSPSNMFDLGAQFTFNSLITNNGARSVSAPSTSAIASWGSSSRRAAWRTAEGSTTWLRFRSRVGRGGRRRGGRRGGTGWDAGAREARGELLRGASGEGPPTR